MMSALNRKIRKPQTPLGLEALQLPPDPKPEGSPYSRTPKDPLKDPFNGTPQNCP